jgi:hypothetical protein
VSNILRNEKTALIGVTLPFFPVGTFVLLVLLSFVSSTLNSIVAVDKLILLTVVLSPLIYVLCAVVSVAALFKSEMKMTASIGIVLNIALLIAYLYFSNAVLMEFEFVI